MVSLAHFIDEGERPVKALHFLPPLESCDVSQNKIEKLTIMTACYCAAGLVCYCGIAKQKLSGTTSKS